MSSCLQINEQRWNLCGSDGLKFFLPREHRDGSLYFQTDWSFLPDTVEPAAAPADAPKLRLRLIGWVPGLSDWRDLENLFLGYHEPIDGKQLEGTRGPDMWIWRPGETLPLKYSFWETDLKFGERHGREFEFSLTGSVPSQRASRLQMELSLKQFFRQPMPADWELPEWANETEFEMSFSGRVEFREIFCSAPINSPRPVDWATDRARRELALAEFGNCTVHDTDCPGKFKIRDVSPTGRVVVMNLSAG